MSTDPRARSAPSTAAALDEVFFKWRFYVREYRPHTDRQIVDLTWYISAAERSIEYDAPAAPAGTPPDEAVHIITSNFTMS